MIPPTPFKSVELGVLRKVAPLFDCEVVEGPAGDVWLDRAGRTYLLMVADGMVPGDSVYYGCLALKIEPIDLYIALARERGSNAGP